MHLVENIGCFLVSGNELVQVKCDFDVQLPPASPVKGWQEIANINMSDPTNSCPSPLRETTSPSRRCEKSSDSAGCESVFFPTNSVPFSKLCGRAVGFSYHSSDALNVIHGICSSSQCETIDDPYVDGLSITYTNNTRVHIWTLAVDQPHDSSRCPCGNSLYSTPSFVGNDYYCEVAVNNCSPVWEGEGCTDVHPTDAACCENPKSNSLQNQGRLGFPTSLGSVESLISR